MVPNHIGFIMDGNGRWAKARGLSRTDGYEEGLNALKKVLERCRQLGVKAVSVYAFSKENWSRPKKEIDSIFSKVEKFNKKYDGTFKITYMGDRLSLDKNLASSINSIEKRTAKNTDMTVNIAFNYSGRDDVLQSAKRCFDDGNFSVDAFEKNLGSAHLPQLDVVVRTSGEKRLSGFMLYEASYAELIFIDKCWPDMNESDVDDIVKEFESRTRKFGA
ncbi:MAG: polyprenyl diphosphate synthase [Clostridia bacterium]